MVDSLYYSSRKISERCENSFVNYRIYYQKLCYSLRRIWTKPLCQNCVKIFVCQICIKTMSNDGPNSCSFYLTWFWHMPNICQIVARAYWTGSQNRSILTAGWSMIDRAVASLTFPGGQEFHFPQFFLKFWSIFPQTLLIFFLIWPSGWASRPPGKALATPLMIDQLNIQNKVGPIEPMDIALD